MEKANHTAAQRFWRTLPDDVTVEEAQARLENWCRTRGDVRLRATADGRSSVAVLFAAEPLAPVPTPFPAVVSVTRVVSAQALVSLRSPAGNRYSVPPHLHGATFTIHVRLGGIRDDGQVIALDDFDCDAASGIDPHLIADLATGRYLESATNVLMIGPPGVGKTHLTVGLSRKSAEDRVPHLRHQPPARRHRRPLPPGRDRGTLGHHHAVLRRSHPAGDQPPT